MKTVLVTGASSGFGMQMLSDFLELGYTVIGTLRKLEERKPLFKDLLSKYPGKLILKELDVTKGDEIKSLSDFIKNEYPKLDVLINNAGFGTYGALEDTTEEQLRYQMEVNFFGPALLTREVLPSLRSAQGKIINISSLMGRYSCPLASVYSSSKYALEGLSEGLMYELKAFNVQVCTVQPGGHRTNFADAVVWGEKSFDESSPYKAQTNGFYKMYKKMTGRKSAPGALGVSKKVVKLCQMSKMPRSVTVGKDAGLVSYLQAFLPQNMYRFVMFQANKQVMGP